jgi:hypothetical protein
MAAVSDVLGSLYTPWLTSGAACTARAPALYAAVTIRRHNAVAPTCTCNIHFTGSLLIVPPARFHPRQPQDPFGCTSTRSSQGANPGLRRADRGSHTPSVHYSTSSAEAATRCCQGSWECCAALLCCVIAQHECTRPDSCGLRGTVSLSWRGFRFQLFLLGAAHSLVTSGCYSRQNVWGWGSKQFAWVLCCIACADVTSQG